MNSLAVLLACLLFSAPGASALGGFEIRAKSDAPTESDAPGFSLMLLDTQDEDFLVSALAVVPKSFNAKGAMLKLVNEKGEKVAGVDTIGQDAPTNKPETWFEFRISPSFLKNSQFVVWRMTEENGLEYATFVLGTFALRDLPDRPESKFPPRIWLPLAEFGLFKKYIATDEFTLTDIVPLEEGQQFGFRLYIRGDGRSVPMKVEMVAPRAPKTWGNPSESLKISPDGRVATWEGMVPTEKLVEKFGEMAEGDPEGEYETRVYIREQLMKTFKYTVRKEPEN